MITDIVLPIIGCILIAAVIAWPLLFGYQLGRQGGRIYSDNTPSLGPHHWNPPMGSGDGGN